MKKGQMTLFVVLGIIIVIVIGVALYYKGAISESIEKTEIAEREALTEDQKQTVKFVEDCLEETLEDALIIVSATGGYYPPREDSGIYDLLIVPSYYNKGVEVVPTKEEVAQSLGRFIDDNILMCLGDAVEALDEPSTEVDFKNAVQAKLTMKVQVGDSKVSKFFAEVPVNYGTVLDSVFEFYEIVKKFTGSMEMVEISEHLLQKDYKYFYDITANKTTYILFWENITDEMTLVYPFSVEPKVVGFPEGYEPIPLPDVLEEFLGEDEDEEEEEEDEGEDEETASLSDDELMEKIFEELDQEDFSDVEPEGEGA